MSDVVGGSARGGGLIDIGALGLLAPTFCRCVPYLIFAGVIGLPTLHLRLAPLITSRLCNQCPQIPILTVTTSWPSYFVSFYGRHALALEVGHSHHELAVQPVSTDPYTNCYYFLAILH